ncbi:DEAD/DEAH box helicase family protein [Campylobacter jejuni]|uniref:DEAD/DEAH box helicase n=1 Tax=Campylobacter jejuni TaxID=197 RepID=A0A6F9MSB6_CAMJU|nr:DEAD/DEAH box helicase family protein [Campylobacter coli]NHH48592.1 DEAD/DEAH box helicase family protein [Campylobacter coli]
MLNKKLNELLQDEFGKRGIEQIEIPFYIKENLSKELRVYQEKALKYYYANFDSMKQRHLMFNMATGSGKTLIMAALILDCYKKGYRNFIFFVNSTSILEKTKSNFANKYSSKYLFKENINIDSKNIEINIINNLFESKNECINIHFTTIQALFSLFKNERENSLSFEDLKDKKLVFLADEAHHLNSDTKSKNENELKEGWEAIIKRAYESNSENLLFEFSATIPQEFNVLEKYQDKIIYEYTLREFCKDGYSKRIFLVKYDNDSLEHRFLGAVLCSLYRELLAQKYNIALKPVVLFKSESIKESMQNQEKFIDFIDSLESIHIEDFYKNINKESDLLNKSLEFFKREYQNTYSKTIVNFLKNNFKTLYILNTNEDKELEKNQILLNCLEEKDNQIRVIFCVDKLNEGWDVLNLFDIVRLGNKKTSKTITTKEAQLIGRGARYYPFKGNLFDFDDELKFKRKYDSDLENELNTLERLTYHTRNDVEFIKQLNESMNKEGLLFEEEKTRIDLIVNEKIKEIVENNKIYYANNKRIKKRDLKNFYITRIEMEQKIKGLPIPYFSNSIKESEEKFEEIKEEYDLQKLSALNHIDNIYFLKAMNILGLDFNKINENFTFKSKQDFVENCLKNIVVCFSKRQEFNQINNLEIAKYILENFKSFKQDIKQEYEVSEFKTHKFNIGNKVVFKNNENFQETNFEWLYHKNFCFDSKLEKDFLIFIEKYKDEIDKIFSDWFVIRNEGFEEFKIYDNRKDEVTYAMGFEPDFIFFGKKNKDSDNFLSIQCFIETKGEHLAMAKDTWKEEFLDTLKGKILTTKDDKNLTLQSLPFFINKDFKMNDKFVSSFEEFLQS